jgi:hypothetical protein
MWPFAPSRMAEDDHRRLNKVVEDVESLSRRFASIVEEVDEYFRKVNKARQRVVKEDADAKTRGEAAPTPGELTKDVLRQRVRLTRREG